jgi:multidrug efflux system membrane fusion protein
MKKTQRITLSIVAAFAIGAGYWSWSTLRAGPEKVAKEVPPVPVLLARATTQDLPVQLDVVGRAEAYQNVTLRSRVDGQVATLLFTEGQHVKEGDELIRLDTTDFSLRLRQAEANQARDEAQLAKAKGDTARYVELRGRNFVSEEKVNEIRTVEATAAATLGADNAALGLARSQLSYASIRAPFSGVIGAKLIFPGGAVKANDTGLAVINRIQPLYVTFSIPEKYLAKLRGVLPKNGDACRPDDCLRVSVSLPGDRNRSFEGRLRFIDNAVDATTGTILVKALLENKDESLTPGQFLNVSLNLDTLPNAVVVPNEAIQQGPEGSFVFLLDAQGKAEVRKIEVASSFGKATAVAKGLQAGDVVVTDGQLRLTPGASIVARDDKPEPTAPMK